MKAILYIILFLNIIAIGQIDKGFEYIHKCELDHNRSIHDFDMLSDSYYDWIYAECHWIIDPNVRYIYGRIEYRIQALEDIEEIKLNCSDSLNIDYIVFNNDSLEWHHQNDFLEIELDTLIAKDSLIEFSIQYEGRPTSTGHGSFTQFAHSNGPIVWTLSEPYGAKDWWPNKSNLKDKLDSIDIYIEVPDSNRAASNGILNDSIFNNSSKTWTFHWKHRYPIVYYLIALSVTNYKVIQHEIELSEGSLNILNYLYPAGIESYLARKESFIETFQLFDSLFGAYPFMNEKYGHAQFGWGGGMEHQTMSFMGNFGHELTAHELAHQWFGNKVTCGSWEDIWLNESFATYLTGITYEHQFAGIYWKIWKRLIVERITSSPDGSVIVDDTTNVSRIFDGRLSYYKGAMVLHMLRQKIGDKVFFKSLKEYLNHPNLSHKHALTQDFFSIIDSNCQCSTDTFMNQWLYQEGHPIFSINYEQTDKGLQLYVEQTPSNPSVDFFQVEIELKINDDQIINLELDRNKGTYYYPYFESIDSIVFNPNYNSLAELDGNITDVSYSEDNIKVYYNPNTHNFDIQILSHQIAMDEYLIIDLSGKIIYQNDFYEKTLNNKAFQGPLNFSINVENLSKGSYLFITKKNGGITSSKKVLKI